MAIEANEIEIKCLAILRDFNTTECTGTNI